MPRRATSLRLHLCLTVLALFAFCALRLPAQDLSGSPMDGAHAFRDLSGTVTDPHHEPLRGAIVQLQQGDNPSIQTYITGADGHYRFLRLNGNADYRVWVKFRDRTSHTRNISKFDTHMQKVIDFSLESF